MNVVNLNLQINSENYINIIKYLQIPKFETRLVGGCVRDAILGIKNTDIDFASQLLPSKVISLLSSYNHQIKIIDKGIKFGCITVYYNQEKFEITTLRKDVSCDGRHANVIFTNDFQLDAARRDFTINALSYCPYDNSIYDYFHGIDDLKNKRVLFIGNPETRIKEDYLRILRFFRFSNKYAFNIDENALNSCIKLKNGLNKLSKERIKDEMNRLLIINHYNRALKIIYDENIYQYIFPFKWNYLALNNAINFINQESIKQFSINIPICLRYAILFIDNTDINIDNLIKYKFTRYESKQIYKIINFIKNIKNQIINQDFLKKIWLQYTDYINYIIVLVSIDLISYNDATNFIIEHFDTKVSKFEITGYDLIELGIHYNKIKYYKDYLYNIWLNDESKKSKQSLLNHLKQILK